MSGERKLAHARGLYLEGIRDGRPREAIARYTGARYTQHSTGVADGRDGFIEFFEPFLERNPVRDIQILRSIVDGRHVFLHVYQSLNHGEARWVTADLFDTDARDRIVEHWDVITEFKDHTVSGHSQVGGETEICDLGRTEANKATVSEFLERVLRRGEHDALHHYIAQDLLQHHTTIADGLEGFSDYLRELGEEGRPLIYRQIHRLVGQGNFVASLSEVELRGQVLAVFDIFRLDGSKIVEHWEAAEPVPTGPQPNGGKF